MIMSWNGYFVVLALDCYSLDWKSLTWLGFGSTESGRKSFIKLQLLPNSLLKLVFVGGGLTSHRVNLFQTHRVSRQNIVLNAIRKWRKSSLSSSKRVRRIYNFVSKSGLRFIFLSRWNLGNTQRIRFEPSASLWSFCWFRHVLLATVSGMYNLMFWSRNRPSVNIILSRMSLFDLNWSCLKINQLCRL